jgi:hypothetical protein
MLALVPGLQGRHPIDAHDRGAPHAHELARVQAAHQAHHALAQQVAPGAAPISPAIVTAELLHFLGEEVDYLVVAAARPLRLTGGASSVTLGLLVNDHA